MAETTEDMLAKNAKFAAARKAGSVRRYSGYEVINYEEKRDQLIDPAIKAWAEAQDRHGR